MISASSALALRLLDLYDFRLLVTRPNWWPAPFSVSFDEKRFRASSGSSRLLLIPFALPSSSSSWEDAGDPERIVVDVLYELSILKPFFVVC